MRLSKVGVVLAVLGAGVTGSVIASSVQQATDENNMEMVPSGKGWGEPRATDSTGALHSQSLGGQTAQINAAAAASNGIVYHNGPVMLGTTDIYYIWYGNWSGNTATTILTDLANNIGGSPYFNINTTYYNSSNTHISNSVLYSGATTDNYSHGTALSDSAVQAVVSSAITSGRLPKTTNAVYFVLTSADVNATSGFCTQYCGWHTHATISGSDIKYAFVGNPDRCPSSCAAQTTGPNGNAGADGMASIISHELEETVSDPDLNGWYDRRGAENGDKCAWTFGTQSTASNGSKYNMTLGSRRYLIQQNWVNASGGFCAKSY